MMPCKNNIPLSDDYVKRSLLELINRIGYINIRVGNSFPTPFPKLWSQISEGLIRSGKFKVRAAGLEEEAA